MGNSFLAAGAWWVELALVMAMGGGVVAGLGAVAGRWARPGGRQAVWRLAVLALWGLLAAEFVGIGPALVFLTWPRSTWPGRADTQPLPSAQAINAGGMRLHGPMPAASRAQAGGQLLGSRRDAVGLAKVTVPPPDEATPAVGLAPGLVKEPEHRPVAPPSDALVQASGKAAPLPSTPALQHPQVTQAGPRGPFAEHSSLANQAGSAAGALEFAGSPAQEDVASSAFEAETGRGEARWASNPLWAVLLRPRPTFQPQGLAERCGASLARIWALGAAAFLGWVVWKHWRLVRLRAGLPAVGHLGVAQRAGQLATKLGLRRPVELLESAEIRSPVAFGVLRPALVLPAGFCAEFDLAQQEVMLAHELAHLAHHDPLWLLACDALCAVLWWHPAVWFVRQQLRSASELAADESSLLVPGGPEVLASCLVDLARRTAREGKLGWLSVAGGGFRSVLGRRVDRLLGLRLGEGARRGRLIRAAIPAGFVVSMVGILVLWLTWVHAQAGLCQGETTMSVLRATWQRSLAALAAAAFLGPAPASAVAAEHPDAPKAVAPRERPDRPKEAPPERGPAERPRDVSRPGEGRRGEREGRPAAELPPHQRELFQRREQLEREARQIGEQLERARPESDDARELRGKLERIRREIAEISHQLPPREGPRREGPRGQFPPHLREQAERLEQLQEKARDLRAQLQQARPESDDARVLREKLEALHREMTDIQRQMRTPPRKPEGPPGPHPELGRLPPEEHQRRMHHLHAAAENLRAAGMHELAERVLREAEGPPAAGGPMPPPAPPELARAIHELTGQVQQLRREVEELRGQVRRLQQAEKEEEERERPKEKPAPRG